MKTVRQIYQINAPVEKVWQALVDPKVIDQWGGGPVVMTDQENKSFSLWGGDIHGKNIKVIKNKMLVQEWFGGKWDKPSIVTFTLKEKDYGTEIDLIHKDIPDREAKDIADGWDSYYLGPMKKLLEKQNYDQ